jgi:hypothetical protein
MNSDESMMDSDESILYTDGVFSNQDIMYQLIERWLSSYHQYISMMTNKMISSIVRILADKRYEGYNSGHKERCILIAGDYCNYMIRRCTLINMNLVYKCGDNDMILRISKKYEEKYGRIDEKELLIAYKYGNEDRIDYLENSDAELDLTHTDEHTIKDVLDYACDSGKLDVVKRAMIYVRERYKQDVSDMYYDCYTICWRSKEHDLIEYFEEVFREFLVDNMSIDRDKHTQYMLGCKITGIIQSGDYKLYLNTVHGTDEVLESTCDNQRYIRDNSRHVIFYDIGVSGSIDMYRDICRIAGYDEKLMDDEFVIKLYEMGHQEFIEYYDIKMEIDNIEDFENLMKYAVKGGKLSLVERAYNDRWIAMVVGNNSYADNEEILKMIDYDELIASICNKGYDDITEWLREKKQLYT